MIELEEVKQMMIDTYGMMGQRFEPSEEDLREYVEVLDLDRDGKIGLEDLQSYLIKINKIEI